ncbi:MAG TPA: TetR/AcrR family transcriptional regulator [Jatrophihabitans sp.]
MSQTRRPRTGLSRDRVLEGAIRLADAGGIHSLTIRSLAAELGVKPMSIYYYVADKDAILDGLVDLVFSEIYRPQPGQDWRAEMLRRCQSARAVLKRHRWAIGLLESRTHPGPETLRHHDAVLGTLRAGGFSRPLTAHAYALIDSYLYGFALQEAALPFEGPDGVDEVAASVMPLMTPEAYPHLVDMTTSYYLRPGYDFGAEFEFGMGLLLDALAQLAAQQR